MAFETEVQRGIALLDSALPGWRQQIDLDRLNMLRAERDRNGCGCILTQAYGSYWDGLVALDFDWYASEDADYGFDVLGTNRPDSEYRVLTEAWKRALTTGGAP